MVQPLQLVRFSLAYLLSFDHYNSSLSVSFCDTSDSVKCFNLTISKQTIFLPVFVLVVCRLGLQPTNIQTTVKQGTPFCWLVLLWLYVCKN